MLVRLVHLSLRAGRFAFRAQHVGLRRVVRSRAGGERDLRLMIRDAASGGVGAWRIRPGGIVKGGGRQAQDGSV